MRIGDRLKPLGLSTIVVAEKRTLLEMVLRPWAVCWNGLSVLDDFLWLVSQRSITEGWALRPL